MKKNSFFIAGEWACDFIIITDSTVRGEEVNYKFPVFKWIKPGEEIKVKRPEKFALQKILKKNLGNKKDPLWEKLVEYLVINGCDLNAETENGDTPLSIAIEMKSIYYAKMFILFGADIGPKERGKNMRLFIM